jgi:hypothetical protein
VLLLVLLKLEEKITPTYLFILFRDIPSSLISRYPIFFYFNWKKSNSVNSLNKIAVTERRQFQSMRIFTLFIDRIVIEHSSRYTQMKRSTLLPIWLQTEQWTSFHYCTCAREVVARIHTPLLTAQTYSPWGTYGAHRAHLRSPTGLLELPRV